MKSFTLARLKGIAAFLGSLLTFLTTLEWGFEVPVWVTGIAAGLTFIAVYAVPNIDVEDSETSDYEPRRAADDA